MLNAVATAWKLDSRQTGALAHLVEEALGSGWQGATLAERLTGNTAGARDPLRVLMSRLTSLPEPNVAQPQTPWCGECEDPHSRTITVTLPDGTEAAKFCPACSPQRHHLTRPVGTSSQ